MTVFDFMALGFGDQTLAIPNAVSDEHMCSGPKPAFIWYMLAACLGRTPSQSLPALRGFEQTNEARPGVGASRYRLGRARLIVLLVATRVGEWNFVRLTWPNSGGMLARPPLTFSSRSYERERVDLCPRIHVQSTRSRSYAANFSSKLPSFHTVS